MGRRVCDHIKTDGTICGSPVLKNRDYCYFHYRHHLRERHRILLNSRAEKASEPAVELPVLEDRASIQVAIMDVLGAIIDRRIPQKDASLLLYGLQLASNNLAGHELSSDSDLITLRVPLHPDDDERYQPRKRASRKKPPASVQLPIPIDAATVSMPQPPVPLLNANSGETGS